MSNVLPQQQQQQTIIYTQEQHDPIARELISILYDGCFGNSPDLQNAVYARLEAVSQHELFLLVLSEIVRGDYSHLLSLTDDTSADVAMLTTTTNITTTNNNGGSSGTNANMSDRSNSNTALKQTAVRMSAAIVMKNSLNQRNIYMLNMARNNALAAESSDLSLHNSLRSVEDAQVGMYSDLGLGAVKAPLNPTTMRSIFSALMSVMVTKSPPVSSQLLNAVAAALAALLALTYSTSSRRPTVSDTISLVLNSSLRIDGNPSASSSMADPYPSNDLELDSLQIWNPASTSILEMITSTDLTWNRNALKILVALCEHEGYAFQVANERSKLFFNSMSHLMNLGSMCKEESKIDLVSQLLSALYSIFTVDNDLVEVMSDDYIKLLSYLSSAYRMSHCILLSIAQALCLLLDVLPHALGPFLGDISQLMLELTSRKQVVFDEKPTSMGIPQQQQQQLPSSASHPPFESTNSGFPGPGQVNSNASANTNSREASIQLVLQACEFWAIFAEVESAIEVLTPLAPVLFPILIDNLAYDQMESDVLMSEVEHEAFTVPDNRSEIRVRFHRSRMRRDPSSQNPADSDNEAICGSDQSRDGTCEDDDDDLEYDRDDGIDDDYSDWNIRKSSARTIEALSRRIPANAVLGTILPILELKLGYDQAWQQPESALLALGAIADGYGPFMEAHVKSLLVHVGNHLKHENPYIRAISCWTISRYLTRFMTRKDINNPACFSEQEVSMVHWILNNLLRCVLDSNKRVQYAACSAVAVFQEIAAGSPFNEITLVIEALCHALELYQERNLIALYDALSTLAEYAIHEFRILAPVTLERVIMSIVKRWSLSANTDISFASLMSCTRNLVHALGTSSAVFAPHMIPRCAAVALQSMAEIKNDLRDDISLDRLVCSLDLVSSFVFVLRETMDSLLLVYGFDVVIFRSWMVNQLTVRLSVVSLVGELWRADLKTFGLKLHPCVIDIVEMLEANEFFKICSKNQCVHVTWNDVIEVCSSAIWSLGELSMYLVRRKQESAAAEGLLLSTNELSGPLGYSISQVLTQMDQDGTPPATTCSVTQLGYLLGTLLPVVIPKLIVGINRPVRSGSVLAENAAVCICRLSILDPALFSTNLNVLVRGLCQALKGVNEHDMRESGMEGLCYLIRANPECLLGDLETRDSLFLAFAETAATCKGLSRRMETELGQVLAYYKNRIGAHLWEGLMSKSILSTSLLSILHERFLL